MSLDSLPYPPSQNDQFPRPSATLDSVPVVPAATRSYSDHLPYQPAQIRSRSEKWTPLGVKVDWSACGELNKSRVDAALLHKQITGKTSEPDAAFMETVDKLLNRANEELLKEIPRCALAQAYADRAHTHGENLEKAIVDCFVSLQLFPADTMTQEMTQEIQVQRLMLNMLKTLWDKPGIA
ncbi:hypothetical protein C8R45DRAFT_1104361 [Mycena sanguinolenta]|nr:hypothetical protein C8R45DRAFT_1104361 [Mycena sanguinolenta]